MTPAEKAKELYEKFSLYTSTGDEDDVFGEYKKANKYFNKNACLLCVDEIINANPTEYILCGTSGPDANYTAHYEYENNESYWIQVKQELQKM